MFKQTDTSTAIFLTHDEAIVASVLTVEQAVAGLKEEETRLSVVVIGGDTKGSETLALSQQLLLPGVSSLVWCSLEKHGNEPGHKKRTEDESKFGISSYTQ